MKDHPPSKRLTCIQCGADLTQSSTHTLMDCIQHLRRENRMLKEQLEKAQKPSSSEQDIDHTD